MSVFLKELLGSMILMISGIIMFSICRSVEAYREYYYYIDRTDYIIVHVFFWVGLMFFITGLINMGRVSVVRRSQFRGITLRTAPNPMQPTSVTVVGTVLPAQFNQQQYYQGQAFYPGQQIYPPQPGNMGQSLPPMPPPYTPTDTKLEHNGFS